MSDNNHCLHFNPVTMSGLRSGSQELWHTMEKEPTLNLSLGSQELRHSVEKEPTLNLRSASQELWHTVEKEPTPNGNENTRSH